MATPFVRRCLQATPLLVGVAASLLLVNRGGGEGRPTSSFARVKDHFYFIFS
jgi:hypothetical protein